MNERELRVKVLPLILGPKNTEAAVGFPYRWVRDTATALGLPFVGHGKKRGVRADIFLEALERGVVKVPAPESEQAASVEVTDAAAHVRAMLGKRLKVGGE